MQRYSTLDIARECNVSRWMVTRLLRRHWPGRHDAYEWWRFEPEEYELICNTVKSAKLSCPMQPLHALEKGQTFLVFG